jgi:dienelactone hydrolase
MPSSNLNTVRLEVKPSRALADEPFTVRLTGARPAQRITLRATMTLQWGDRWQAEATWMIDPQGQLDLSAHAPESGTFAVADPMGLIWSMRLQDPGTPPSAPTIQSAESWVIEVRAEADGHVLATTIVERLFAAPGVVREVIREEGLVATLFTPPTAGPHLVVVTLSGSNGGLNEQPAALFASHGYAGLALAYFGIESLPSRIAELPLEYFERAFQWLRRRGVVSEAGIAVSGGSRGGELALLLGATFPTVRCVVAYVPSGVLHAGVAADNTWTASTWSYQGAPLPFVQFEPSQVDWQAPGVMLRPGYQAALEDKERVRAAEIAVECTKGPILLISGADDQMWPSAAMAELAMARLRRSRFPYAYEHVCYEGAGHLITLPPYRPSIVSPARHPVVPFTFMFGGTARANARASEDSWRRVLALLSSAMKRSSQGA